jgi:AraC-like DNA-binding protein
MTSFRFFPVAPPLAHYVEYLYTSVVSKQFGEQFTGCRLPELSPQLVFALEQETRFFPGEQAGRNGLHASLFLQPAHLQVIPIPGTIREAVGASLRPSGIRLLLPRGAAELSSAPLIPLADLCGERARSLLTRLIEEPGPLERLAVMRSYLTGLAARGERIHRCAHHALQLLEAAGGDISVEMIAANCGVTSRTLRSVLLSETGLPTKQLARIARIRSALQSLRRRDAHLSPAKLCSAFADQSHMCREFRTLLGTTPGALGRQIGGSALSRQIDPGEPLPSYRTERDLVGTGLLLIGRGEATPTRSGFPPDDD